MSEVDEKGDILATFTDVNVPVLLSSDGEDGVLVADSGKNRILLLSRELRLERILVHGKNQWLPMRLYYNDLTSHLYVLHGSRKRLWTIGLSLFSLR